MGELFKNAKFGDKFKTEGGYRALFIQESTYQKKTEFELVAEIPLDEGKFAYYTFHVNDKGRHKSNDLNVVSRLEEPFNAEKIADMSRESYKEHLNKDYNPFDQLCMYYQSGFFDGYKKAKQA